MWSCPLYCKLSRSKTSWFNICNSRFEVLDSMRTLEDSTLRTCRDEIVESIKHLWSEYYSESKAVIENYKIVPISVPAQNNNHDCGFHMLMHVEYWDGRKVCNFNEKDMPNIRKLLTYKWFTHEENDTKWKSKFWPGKEVLHLQRQAILTINSTYNTNCYYLF